jgi:hypothetical protein
MHSLQELPKAAIFFSGDTLSPLIIAPPVVPDANLHANFSAVVTATLHGFREDDDTLNNGH